MLVSNYQFQTHCINYHSVCLHLIRCVSIFVSVCVHGDVATECTNMCVHVAILANMSVREYT